MKSFAKRIMRYTLIISIVLLIFFLIFKACNTFEVYETNNIADYGECVGNYDNATPRSFIYSFFPETIEDIFSDVSYHYKAKKFDTYAFECYLEFVIEDTESFLDFLNKHIDPTKAKTFAFDDSYKMYPISNHLRLQTPATEDGVYAISSAEIGNILYSVDEQRIIFMAMGVFDGGGTRTSELNFFFNRFGIDAWAYMTIYAE